jgi:hypothetical protein
LRLASSTPSVGRTEKARHVWRTVPATHPPRARGRPSKNSCAPAREPKQVSAAAVAQSRFSPQNRGPSTRDGTFAERWFTRRLSRRCRPSLRSVGWLIACATVAGIWTSSAAPKPWSQSRPRGAPGAGDRHYRASPMGSLVRYRRDHECDRTGRLRERARLRGHAQCADPGSAVFVGDSASAGRPTRRRLGSRREHQPGCVDDR